MVVLETNFVMHPSALCSDCGLEGLEGVKTLQDEATASRWKFIWGKHPGKKAQKPHTAFEGRPPR